MFEFINALPTSIQVLLVLTLIGYVYVICMVACCDKVSPNPVARTMLKVYWKPNPKVKTVSVLIYIGVAAVLHYFVGMIGVYAMIAYAVSDVCLYGIVRLISRNYTYVLLWLRSKSVHVWIRSDNA